MAPRLEMVTEEFCPWPYYQPYVFSQRKKNKPRAKKVATLAAKPAVHRDVQTVLRSSTRDHNTIGP